jgi:hypothetical protein
LLSTSRKLSRTIPRSPKIRVDVMGSKPNASPKGLGRSPTIAFPSAETSTGDGWLIGAEARESPIITTVRSPPDLRTKV